MQTQNGVIYLFEDLHQPETKTWVGIELQIIVSHRQFCADQIKIHGELKAWRERTDLSQKKKHSLQLPSNEVRPGRKSFPGHPSFSWCLYNQVHNKLKDWWYKKTSNREVGITHDKDLSF